MISIFYLITLAVFVSIGLAFGATIVRAAILVCANFPKRKANKTK